LVIADPHDARFEFSEGCDRKKGGVMRSRVCLVGMFPPPLHGMSLINAYLRKRIAETDEPYVIDFSPRKLDRSFMVRFGKLFRVIGCAFQLFAYLVTGRVHSVYLGLSGGNGQIYDSLFAGLSRLMCKKLYLHHHSYHYLNQVRWVAKLLMGVAGRKAVHIVACEKMASDLKLLYPMVGEVRIVSGIAALESWIGEVHQRTEIQTIGFLSNISVEKGILEFLEIAAGADHAKSPIRFLLAGPYQDNEVRLLVEQYMAILNNLTYIGAVYGSHKQAFFDSIDVFLLPSHNESEGLVIHEAMSRGVPVIAYSRGCIEQIVSEQVGLRLNPSDDFVGKTIDKINEWLANPSAYQLVSYASLRQFNQARTLHIKNFEKLCAELLEKEISP
jgi:glycosyltransferase involved in cell wall biosynthesis